MRGKLVFKKLKMTDHLCLQKAKKVKNRHNQDEKLPFSLKVKEIDRWRLVKYYFKKVYVLHCRFSGWQTKTKAFPSIGNYTLFHANTGEKIFHSPVNQHGHLVTW